MGPSRYYHLYLTNPDNLSQSIPYWRISNDGNLLPKPLLVNNMSLIPGERGDIIVDFNKLTALGGAAQGATRLWLENRLLQTAGEGPTTTIQAAGKVENVLMEFRIGAVTADASRDPSTITDFAPITPLPPIEAPVITRNFVFGRNQNEWLINGKLINCDEVRFAMKINTTEKWIFQNGFNWAHPIHNHFVEGRVTKRNGVATAANSQENSRKDVVDLRSGDTIEYMIKVTDYIGVYPMHCHNVVHEDHAMMLLFEVNLVGDTNTRP
jgi:FtsP/CotA-like multicopper oxidase with cupredoxin domain